jgi:hypothetical protein
MITKNRHISILSAFAGLTGKYAPQSGKGFCKGVPALCKATAVACWRIRSFHCPELAVFSPQTAAERASIVSTATGIQAAKMGICALS